MPRAFLFDLDMTLVDSSALAALRRNQMWVDVNQNMSLIRPFSRHGQIAPHEIPGRIKDEGYTVGVVTSSPDWYAKQVLEQFRIPYDVLVSYGDTENHKPDPDPIQRALTELGIEASPRSFYIGDNVSDVEAAYHAGLTSIGVKWGLTPVYELSSAAPDIYIAKPAMVQELDKLEGRRYIGEALIGSLPFFPHWGSILQCDDDATVYALGRYFTSSDPRHATSSLTAAVLSLKHDDQHAAALGECLGRAIASLDWTPDYVVPVPMKPSQKRNRFAQLLQTAARYFNGETEVEIEGLSCIKEVEGYKQMSPLKRAEAIRGAFASNFEWGGTKILLIDDVYTTGGTTNECARMLSLDNASEVRVMTLAKDQRVFSRKSCPACGRQMKVRENGRTHEKFWGCSGYPDECRHTENFNA